VHTHGRLVDVCTHQHLLTDSVIFNLVKNHHPFYTKRRGRWAFTEAEFGRYLHAHGLAEQWPRTDTGGYSTARDDLGGCTDPVIVALRECRTVESVLRNFRGTPSLAWCDHYGSDHRQRPYFAPYGSVTGRNQPAASQFVLALPSWLRSLIEAPEGCAITGLDWGKQEFAVAAALSGDTVMAEAYRSGDPYLFFAQTAGMTAPTDTADACKSARDLAKSTVLGLQYGMGLPGLHRKLCVDCGRQVPRETAEHLLQLHKRTFRQYWRWAWDLERLRTSNHTLELVDGWRVHTANLATLTCRNWPVQGTGAVILRRALVYAFEEGLPVVAPLHDAVYIEHRIGDTDPVDRMETLMHRATAEVLDGRIDITIERGTHPHGTIWLERKGAKHYARFAKLLQWEA